MLLMTRGEESSLLPYSRTAVHVIRIYGGVGGGLSDGAPYPDGRLLVCIRPLTHVNAVNCALAALVRCKIDRVGGVVEDGMRVRIL